MGCGDSKEKEEKSSKRNGDERDDAGGAGGKKSRSGAGGKGGAGGPGDKYSEDQFRFGGPTIKGEIHPCFDNEGDGMLYRVINEESPDGPIWAFYNDTVDYEMHVIYDFDVKSTIKALGETSLKRCGNGGPEDGFEARLIVYPGETKEYIQGQHQGYETHSQAVALSDEYRERMAAKAHATVASELSTVKKLAHGRTNDEDILDACIRQQVAFVDLNFPPEKISLCRGPQLDRRDIPSVPWMRPTQYLPHRDRKKLVLIDTAEPNDIDQGSLGDCWFLCSVASLAEVNKGSKIVDIFATPKGKDGALEQKLGAYRVTINKNGWWEMIIVDDYLPTVGGIPWFAHNRENPSELWVALLEKAYAKLHGSYASITGGDALLALQDLSGYPTNRLDTVWKGATKNPEESEELFQRLHEWDDKGYLINVNTPGVDNSSYMEAHNASNPREFEEKYRNAGLGMGHAYSVLIVRQFRKHKLQLLQIRNPWGNATEWTGAWGDHSELWKQYPDVAKECGYTGPVDDGTFWMCWEDVKKYFDGGGVCFTKLNWFDYRIRGAFINGFPNVALEIRVTKPVEMFIILSQRDRRGLPKDHRDAKYAATLISLCVPAEGEKPDLKKVRVRWNSTNDAYKPSEKFIFTFTRDLSMVHQFKPNDQPYLVVPRIYDAGASKDYVLGIITSRKVGDGFTVKMKQLPTECRIFRNNYLTFTYDPDTTPDINCPWQFNPEVGTPETREGCALE